MKHSKKGTVQTIITMIILGGLVFSTFMYFSNREDKEKTEVKVELTEVEKILDQDLTKEYPPTAREVIKRYSRIVKCIHSEEVSEEEIIQLGDMVLSLYTDELKENNPREEYMEQLLEEVKEYRSFKKTVISYAIDSGENTITWTEDGVEYARLLATFTTQDDTGFNRVYEEFVLKKENQNQWKILGWRLAEPKDR